MSKKTTYCFFVKGLLTLFWLIAFQLTAIAQNPVKLHWNGEVGCRTYKADPKKGLAEGVDENECLRVCGGSETVYTLSGDNIATVTWAIGGGTYILSDNDLVATVNWGSQQSGNISLTVVLQDGSVQQRNYCVEILKSPTANFSLGNAEEQIRACLNTELYFQDLSVRNGGTDIVAYQWDFGDGNTSNAASPTHTYTSPGNYEVELRVWNECNCSSVIRKTIQVLNRPNIEISCPTVVCYNSLATYTVNDKNCSGEWKVDGGTIINNGGNYITVIWYNMDSMDYWNGVGYVSYRSNCTCPVWTTVKVPVVGSGIFNGDIMICGVGNQSRISLPEWPSTDYQWQILYEGNPTTGVEIVETDQRNEIIVKGLELGTYYMQYTATNTLLGCSASGGTFIYVNEKFDIGGPELVCMGETHQFSASNKVGPHNWILTLNGQSLWPPVNNWLGNGGQTISVTFDQPGVYQLEYRNLGGCTVPKTIVVYPRPAAPSGKIKGPGEICVGVPYTYSYENEDPETDLIWEVSPAATIQGSKMGNEITVIFNNTSNHYVRLKKRLKTSPYCESDPIILPVKRANVSAVITNDDGLTSFCSSSKTSFTATLTTSGVDHLEWSFEEEGAGNILSGKYTLNPTVSFNESSGNAPVYLVLSLKKCGTTTKVKYLINIQPTPVLLPLNMPAEICAQNPIGLSFQSSVYLNNGTLKWILSDGGTLTQTGVSGNTFTIPDELMFASVSDNIGGTVQVILTQPNGCNTTAMLLHDILIKPSPVVHITSQKSFAFCDAVFSETLMANLQSDLSNTTLQWYKEIPGGNDQLLTADAGTNNQQITITQAHGFGTYYVLATAANGCTNRDDAEFLQADCGNGGTNCGDYSEEVTITQTTLSSCNTIEVQAVFTGNPLSGSWLFNNKHLVLNSSVVNGNTITATFTAKIAGKLQIAYTAKYGNAGNICAASGAALIEVPYLPDLRYKVICNAGNNTYTVTVWNNSTYIGAEPDRQLSVGGNTAPLNQSPYTLELQPGTYDLSVVLSRADYPGMPCVKTIPLVLESFPVGNIEVVPAEVCAEDTVKLIPPVNNQEYQYRWSFNGGDSFNTMISPDVNLLAGTTEVSLTITTPTGCVFTYSQSDIRVNRADYSGDVFGARTTCEGTVVNLYYQPTFGGMPSGFQWMRENEVIPGATAQNFQPVVSGSYWVVLYDANGCANYQTPAVSMVFTKPPYARIDGLQRECIYTPFVLKATIENTQYQRRWLRNGTALNTWNTTAALERTFTENTPGTYVYTLEVRNPADPNCISIATHTVTVVNPPATPTLSYTILSCHPYRVELVANGPSAGVYNWSNGEQGQSIVVSEGGPYKVTYSEGATCFSYQEIAVPKNPDGFLWIFPSGCMSFCVREDNTILGPSPNAWFGSYAWVRNGAPVATGNNSFVPDYTAVLSGDYKLQLSNGPCEAVSKPLNVSTYECKGCEVIWKYEIIKRITEPYVSYDIYMEMTNPYPFEVSVTLSSLQHQGVFQSSSFVISPGTSKILNPLKFIPNAQFAPGDLQVGIAMSNPMRQFMCKSEKAMRFPNMEPAKESGTAKLALIPNPASETTLIQYEVNGYDTKEAVAIFVYDIKGIMRWTTKRAPLKGDFLLDVSGWVPGNYIVVIAVNGQTVTQQILVKK